MNVYLSGANGLLGSAFCLNAYKYGHEVFALKQEEYNHTVSLNDLKSRLSNYTDAVFIHCAANTNMDECEIFPDICLRDNVLNTTRLAHTCRLLNIPFIFISSTGVYGEHGNTPYNEYDLTMPTNVHHKSKLAGEKEALANNTNALILRTGWLFGGSISANRNFVAKRIQEANNLEDKVMYSDPFQKGNPTYVDDLVAMAFELIKEKAVGIFNAVNSGSATRFEYVKEIMRIYDDTITVLPTETKFDRKVKVSHNEAAVNDKIQMFTTSPIPHWKVSLFNYINDNREAWTEI